LDVNLPASSVSEIGRQLKLTGDIVFAGAFSDSSARTDGTTAALFFSRLFSQMLDDGVGVFVEHRSFDADRLILNNSIYSEDGSVIGYVADEIVENRPDRTLFCAAVIDVKGLSGVRELLQHYLLWPTLMAIEARCSTCGRVYNARNPSLRWCPHVVDGKQPIANVRVSRLTLVQRKVPQKLSDMLKHGAADGAADGLDVDLIGNVSDIVSKRMVVDGPADELRIVFGVPRSSGIISVDVGPHRLHAGGSIDLPLSLAREWVTSDMLDDGKVVPLTHSGSMRNLLPGPDQQPGGAAGGQPA